MKVYKNNVLITVFKKLKVETGKLYFAVGLDYINESWTILDNDI